jgi:surface antigen
MIQHPAITAALADQRRRALIAEAETARMAHASRDGSATWRWPDSFGHVPRKRWGVGTYGPALSR